MNAQFLERFIQYRATYGIRTAKILLSQKVAYQFVLVRQRTIGAHYAKEIARAGAIQPLLLIEARAAKQYWKLLMEDLLAGKVTWEGRIVHGHDAMNTLLDIGYHYLTERITKLFDAIHLPYELGIFHKAQSQGARSLVYDFIEWMRPFVVDRTLMGVLRKKKRKINAVDERFIAYFLSHVKRGFETPYYHKKLKYCVTLEYWIRLMLLEFMGSVHAQKPYSPYFPSTRHESRCKKPPRKIEAAE